jgi:arylsulfatase A-like enzyme
MVRRMTTRRLLRTACLLGAPLLFTLAGCDDPRGPLPRGPRVIVFVWDGLRPDSISPADTPNLYALSQAGVNFADHHSTFPTFTMMNAAALATGAYPGTTGFYGNTFWIPGPSGGGSDGKPVDFNQPVFSEDYAILKDVDQYYQGQLLSVGTLFEVAQAAGLKTAAVGKSGPVFLQDRKAGGIILDEKVAFPESLIGDLAAAGIALPKTTPIGYPADEIHLSSDNGDPTAAASRKNLLDLPTADPTDASGNPYTKPNGYLADTFINYLLPRFDPRLTVLWLRNPDSTEHAYGVGSPDYKDALRAQDQILGRVLLGLHQNGIADTTDVIVVSDHAHSNVAGPTELFPLRSVVNAGVGEKVSSGFSVSGDVRLADLLTRAGFTAFDGAGCIYDPVMSGIMADGTPVYPTRTDDGTVCGAAGPYTTGSFVVPAQLAPKTIVIASNGGSEYLYVPDHDPATVAAAVAFLQSREEYGAVFVSPRYGDLAGTLPTDLIKVENAAGRSPDIIVSYTFDESAKIQGMRGIEFENMQGNRGMHGSFSPIDVHNTLVASGPHLKTHLTYSLPSANVDVAPTIAAILGLSLPSADGRPLLEALADGPDPESTLVTTGVLHPSQKAGPMTMKLPTDPDGKTLSQHSTYDIELSMKTLTQGGINYPYFDSAKAIRK